MPQNVSYCEQLVREADRDRFLATLFMPAEFRPALFSIYAFDMEIGQISGRVSEPLAGEVRLQWWHDVITGAAREQAAGSPVAATLVETIDRHKLPERIFLDLIEAQRDALYRKPLETLDEFEAWAAKVDGGIVALAARALSASHDPKRDDLCRHAGIALACLRAALPGPDFQGLSDLAERHLVLVRTALPAPAYASLGAFLPLALVRPMLQAIGRTGMPLAPWRRQWILWRASRNLAKFV